MNKLKSDEPIQVKATMTFNASPEKVFDAWLDVEQIKEWMFGPKVRDEKIISLRLEPKKGGTFSFIVDRNGEKINHVGKYLEIVRPNKLVFTWGIDFESEDESVVTVLISATHHGCRLNLFHQLHSKWKDYADRTKNGWQFMLNKLEETLRKMKMS